MKKMMMHSGYGRGVSSFFLFLFALFAGTARAQNGNLLIADFEGGKLETVSGLALAVIADEQLGGTSDAHLTLTHPGAHGSQAALRISFRLGEGFAYPFSGVWALLGTDGLPADLSAYRGLRFYARSKGGAFQAGVRQASGQPANYMAPFTTTPEWTLVELPFDKLQRSPPNGQAAAFVPKNVVSIGFSAAAKPPGQLDLEIDQLELYK